MKSLKKFPVSAFLYAGATVLSLLGFIFVLVTNSVQGNDLGSSSGLGITFAVFSLLLSACGVFVTIRFGNKFWAPIVHLLAVGLNGFLFGFILLNRVELVSSLFTWDSNNSLGWTAFSTAVVAIVFYVLASLLITVGMFLPQEKKTDNTEEVAA